MQSDAQQTIPRAPRPDGPKTFVSPATSASSGACCRAVCDDDEEEEEERGERQDNNRATLRPESRLSQSEPGRVVARAKLY